MIQETRRAVAAVRGHDKIDPDEPECAITWDQWAYIRDKLVEEVLRLVEALPEEDHRE